MTTPATNAFPALGINTAELIAEVERLLEEARTCADEIHNVNWGDLGIMDIEYRLSIQHPENGPSCYVLIEEASPDFALYLQDNLDKTKFPNVFFECEW